MFMKENIIRRIFYIRLLPLLFTAVASAQVKYSPGYIITTDDDTIYGEIRERSSFRNSQACIFRESGNEEPKKYLPFDIKAYRILDGKYYVSKMIPGKEGDQPLFLEFLVKGEASLYVYRDGEKDHFFIEREGQPLVPLKDEKKLVQKTDGVYASYTKEYIGVLKYMFSDYKNLYPEINNLELRDKDLIRFAEDFHAQACEGEKCIIYEKKYRKKIPRFRIALRGGMNLDLLMRNGNDDNDPVNLTYAPSLSFLPALEMTLYFDQTENAGLVLYGSWMNYLVHGDYLLEESLPVYYESFTNISSVRTGLWFKNVFIGKSKLRPFCFAGLLMDLTFDQSTEMIGEREGRTVVRTSYSDTDDGPLAKKYFGPVAGGGVEIPLRHIRPFVQAHLEYLGIRFKNDYSEYSILSTGLSVGICF